MTESKKRNHSKHEIVHNEFAPLMSNGYPYNLDLDWSNEYMKSQDQLNYNHHRKLEHLKKYACQYPASLSLNGDHLKPWYILIPIDQFVKGTYLFGSLKMDEISGFQCKSILYKQILDTFFAVYTRCYEYDLYRKSEDKLYPVLICTEIPAENNDDYEINRLIEPKNTFPTLAAILFRLSIKRQYTTTHNQWNNVREERVVDFNYILSSIEFDCKIARKKTKAYTPDPYQHLKVKESRHRGGNSFRDQEAVEATDDENEEEGGNDDDENEEDEKEEKINTSTVEIENKKVSYYTQFHEIFPPKHYLVTFTLSKWISTVRTFLGFKDRTDITDSFLKHPEQCFNMVSVISRATIVTSSELYTPIHPDWTNPRAYIRIINQNHPNRVRVTNDINSIDEYSERIVYIFPKDGKQSYWLDPSKINVTNWQTTHFPHLRRSETDRSKRTKLSFNLMHTTDSLQRYNAAIQSLGVPLGFQDDSSWLASEDQINKQVEYTIDRLSGDHGGVTIYDWFLSVERKKNKIEDEFCLQLQQTEEIQDEKQLQSTLLHIDQNHFLQKRRVDISCIHEFHKDLFHADGGIYPTLRAVSVWKDDFLKKRIENKEIGNFCFPSRRTEPRLSFFANSCIRLMTGLDILNKTFKHHLNIFRFLISTFHIHLPPIKGKKNDCLKNNFILLSPPGEGKSFVLDTGMGYLIPGTWTELQSMSDQAMQSSGVSEEEMKDPFLKDKFNHIIFFCDDPQGNFITDSFNGVVSNQMNFLKNVMASGKYTRETKIQDPVSGNWKPVSIETKAICQAIFCANTHVRQLNTAIADRSIVIEANHNVLPTKTETFTEEVASEDEMIKLNVYIDWFRSIQYISAILGPLIEAECLKINMDCFFILWPQIVKEGTKAGLYNLTSRRKLKMLKNIVECLVIFSAKCVLFDQLNSPLAGRSFHDSHLLLLRKHLVCTVEHITMGVGLMSTAFEDKALSFTKMELIGWMKSKLDTPAQHIGEEKSQEIDESKREENIALRFLQNRIRRSEPDQEEQKMIQRMSQSIANPVVPVPEKRDLHQVGIKTERKEEERGDKMIWTIQCHYPHFLNNKNTVKEQIQALATHIWPGISKKAQQHSIEYSQFERNLFRLKDERVQVQCYMKTTPSTSTHYKAPNWEMLIDEYMEERILTIDRNRIVVPDLDINEDFSSFHSKLKKCVETVLSYNYSNDNDYLWGNVIPDNPNLFDVLSTRVPLHRDKKSIIVKSIHPQYEETEKILHSMSTTNTIQAYCQTSKPKQVDTVQPYDNFILNMDYDDYVITKFNYDVNNGISEHELKMVPSNKRKEAMKELWLLEGCEINANHAPYPYCMPNYSTIVTRAREKKQEFQLNTDSSLEQSKSIFDHGEQFTQLMNIEKQLSLKRLLEKRKNVILSKKMEEANQVEGIPIPPILDRQQSSGSPSVRDEMEKKTIYRLKERCRYLQSRIQQVYECYITKSVSIKEALQKSNLDLDVIEIGNLSKSTSQVIPDYLLIPEFNSAENTLYANYMIPIGYYTIDPEHCSLVDHKQQSRMIGPNGYFYDEERDKEKKEIEQQLIHYLRNPKSTTEQAIKIRIQKQEEHKYEEEEDEKEEKELVQFQSYFEGDDQDYEAMEDF